MPAKRSSPKDLVASFQAAAVEVPGSAPRGMPAKPAKKTTITTTIDLTPVQYAEWDRVLADLSAMAGRRITRREYVIACISPEGRGVVAKSLGLIP